MLGLREVQGFDLPGGHQPEVRHLTDDGQVPRRELLAKQTEPPRTDSIRAHRGPSFCCNAAPLREEREVWAAGVSTTGPDVHSPPRPVFGSPCGTPLDIQCFLPPRPAPSRRCGPARLARPCWIRKSSVRDREVRALGGRTSPWEQGESANLDHTIGRASGRPISGVIEPRFTAPLRSACDGVAPESAPSEGALSNTRVRRSRFGRRLGNAESLCRGCPQGLLHPGRGRRWPGAGATPGLDGVLRHQLQVALVSTERGEVLDRRHRTALSHHAGVLGCELEAHPRAGIGQHRRSHARLELVKMLVSKHEPNSESSGLTEGISQIRSEMQVVGELVQVDEHRMTTLGRDSRSSERHLPELGQDQRAERARPPRGRPDP